MRKNKNLLSVFMVGTGRWAKEIIKELSNISSIRLSITIYTQNSKLEMEKWLDNVDIRSQIILIDLWPQKNNFKYDLGVIAHKASMHEEYALRLMDLCKYIYIEKPISLTQSGVQEIIRLAKSKGVKIACSNIFLFSNGVIDFEKRFLSNKNIKINAVWEDSIGEIRHGIKKIYDHKIPIYLDILPHILPIIANIVKSWNFSFNGLNFMNGGSLIEIMLKLDGVDINIRLRRNGIHRRRMVKCVFDNSFLVLNFSGLNCEIYKNNNNYLEREIIIQEHGPLKVMLDSLIKSVANSIPIDRRLTTKNSLLSAKIIDEVAVAYQDARTKWLQKLSKTEAVNNFAYLYATRENS